MSLDRDTAEVVELLQRLIRNACVNDGRPESGGETRNADALAAYLEGPGLGVQRFEPLPGRTSLVARIEGSVPEAPSLLLLGHTDVVPANPDRWREDPFGGELIDGEVWGRGAVDMLNLTVSMAVAVRRLADSGFRPAGTLVYAAVADEEALGTHGASWLVEHAREAVAADFVVTEFGGFRLPLPTAAPAVPVMVGEKGASWCTLRVRGRSGHASMPTAADNALVTAAEVVRRLAAYRPTPRLTESWRRFVAAASLPEGVAADLLDPERLPEALAAMGPGIGPMLHACTHATLAPTVLVGGVKTNVIPDRVDLQLDVRTLPGQTFEDVRGMLHEALGPLAGAVEVVADSDERSSESPVDSPLWNAIERATASLVPGARTVPLLLPMATDARFFRRAGATAYGFGLYSDRIAFGDFASMFHGDDERVDVESLRLSTDLWERIARVLLA